jgi:hypothetical protein
MTARDFREIALSFPEAIESAHMSHPDFRVGGRIFATLGYPDEEWGMIKLTAEEQRKFVQANPDMFRPVKGAWGAARKHQYMFIEGSAQCRVAQSRSQTLVRREQR